MIKLCNPGMVMAIALSGLAATFDAHPGTIHSEFRKTIVSRDSKGRTRRVTPDFIAVVEPRVIDVDLSQLPARAPWKPGDPIVTIPRRRGEPRIRNPQPVNETAGKDPLLARQEALGAGRGPSGFTTPILNFEGDRSGSNPHDPNGDVGTSYFVQAINATGGTRFTFHNKADGSVAAGPFILDDLDANACPGRGDPIVVFDEIAGRWLLTEFSSVGNHLCVYVAQTADPINGGWYAYEFQTPNFPDYPKYAVWPDAYYVGTNENSSALYAFEREEMLLGNAATLQRFTIVDPAAFAFAMIPPVDHDGTLAPAEGPGIFIRHFDDEAHDPGNNDPDSDLLQIWEFSVDWDTPENSAVTGPIDIEISEIDSEQCGYTAFACFPQPGTNTTLDPLREVIMNLPKYRNFGAYESILGNLPTDVDGTDHGGVRWFELRRSPARGAAGPWTLYQEGTYAPDIVDGQGAVEHRWMAGSAMDQSGNIAIGFNLSNNTNIYPSLTYEGRLVTDAPGVLTAGETTIVSGTASQTSSTRWGDYSSMSVDPVDECTFWFTSNYGSTASAPTASTRIATFKFDSCGVPTFSIGSDVNHLEACVAGGPGALDEVTLSVASVLGFSHSVDLAFNPALPAEFTGSIDPEVVAPAYPPNLSALNLTAQPGAAAGDYTVTVEGTATDSDPRTVEISVNVADALPIAPGPVSPANGALNIVPRPVFSWSAVSQADVYEIEVATDAGFTGVILQDSANGTAYMPDSDLPAGSELFWRVTAVNQCGPGTPSATFSFKTQGAPGVCLPETETVVYFQDDMEGGENGWSHAAPNPPDTWVLDDSDANSPTMAWNAEGVANPNPDPDDSDQVLISPAVVVPPGVGALTLKFWTRFDLEENQNDPPNCWDGAILEYSTNAGADWTQVEGARLLTLPYTGTVTTGSGNPLAGLFAWCDTQAWTESVVDLSGLEGQTLIFRFRLGTDVSVASGKWHVDDFVVQSCEPLPPLLEFSDGFENP